MNAVVKSGEIPYTDVQLEGITAGATSLRSVASAVRDGTADIVTAWSAISGSYEGPSDQELFDVMTPIGPQGTTFGDDLDSAAKALDTFVEEATPIVAALKAYVTRAEQLQRDVAAFQPQTIQTMDGPVTQTESWDQDETLNGENNDIINGVANRVVEYQAAERKCANAIRSLSGLPALHAITGSGDDALGYGYDELPMGTQLPWGTAESRNESCAEKTTWFLPHLVKGVVWDGVIVGTLGGIGELIGFRDWKWSGDNFVDTWKSLGSLIGYDKESNEWWNGDAAKAGWGGLLKGTLAWDKWADDPGTALGESGWNVVSIVIPFFGVASKVGAVGRTGEVASAISKAGKALDLVDAGAWASRGLTKVLPNLGDLKGVLTNGFEHLPDTFRTRIAEFRIDLNEWRHGSHADADSTVDGPAARSEGAADAAADAHVQAQANASARAHTEGAESNAPTPEREPAMVGGGHGESTTVHGGGSEAGSSGGGGHGTGVPTGGSGGSSGGGGHGTDAGGETAGGMPDRGHQVDPTESFGKVPYGDGVANHAGPGGTTLTDDLTRPGADLPVGVRDVGHSGSPIDSDYGKPRLDHGAFNPNYAAPGDPLYVAPHGGDGHVNPATEQLVTTGSGPDGYYGHHADGTPLTRQDYVERYIKPDDTPRYPGNDGAVSGSRIEFKDPTVFGQYYSTTIDRMGRDTGTYFSFPGTSFEQRGLPPTNLRDPYSVFEMDTDAMKTNGYKVQVSRIDAAFGQPGGGLQVQVMDRFGKPVGADLMLKGNPGAGVLPMLKRTAFTLD
ncbi:TNT domain-containing protein [Curtobacterium sp. MCSS17_007]|uniref:TNT domain-containing protein n=1 Tax=Curtobacterium sp. MCSS17_007 TaxID=2175646 RepID=UPI000DA8BDC4|nr:TNT domain-containing protein [Curtobacterium sp. MCSS17_007]WIE74684.1 TNT domain-containing protein [Curtobacterium sp. MCSS17_007]